MRSGLLSADFSSSSLGLTDFRFSGLFTCFSGIFIAKVAGCSAAAVGGGRLLEEQPVHTSNPSNIGTISAARIYFPIVRDLRAAHGTTFNSRNSNCQDLSEFYASIPYHKFHITPQKPFAARGPIPS